MYYEINVSLNGHHFFATAERSLTSKDKLKKVWEALSKAFPKSEGYEIDASYYETRGESIDMNKRLTDEV